MRETQWETTVMETQWERRCDTVRDPTAAEEGALKR